MAVDGRKISKEVVRLPFSDFKNNFSDALGYKYYRDKKAKAPYQYNASKHLFAIFDDERSIRKKIKFIHRKKSDGIMFWELAQIAKTDGLVDVMYKGKQTPPKR
jgi:chitinase